jgi:hypothetical protein
VVEGHTRQSVSPVRSARILTLAKSTDWDLNVDRASKQLRSMVRSIRRSRSILSLVLAAGCTRTLPPVQNDDPLVVAVISDLNSGYGSTSYDVEVSAAVAHIRAWRPHLVLIAGDMIAGQRPALTDENVRAMWSAFDSVVAGHLRTTGIPFAFTLGNHDASGHPAHERDRRLAAEYWRNPAHTPPLQYVDRGAFPRYYAFLMHGVLFISLDASTGNLHADDAQMSWLRAISRARRRATPP